MSGTVWMFSDQIDDEDIDFMHREFVTYNTRFLPVDTARTAAAVYEAALVPLSLA